MVQYNAVAGPHTHSGQNSRVLMYQVMLALTPAAFVSFVCFGVRVPLLLLSASVTAVLCEALMLRWRGAKVAHALDGSAFLTAWLLVFSLPVSVPIWLVMLGVVFAIVIGKQAYGGLGHNLFNPSMLARVMLLICFPLQLTTWWQAVPLQLGDSGLIANPVWLGVDGVSAATPLASNTANTAMWSLAWGGYGASLGETSAIALLIGGLYLRWRKVITLVIPTAVLSGLLVPAFFCRLIWPEDFLPVSQHLFAGATFLTAFFIATDMVTSPASQRGQWLFGVGCGLLMFLIRSFGQYPEGAAFAVLIMNAFTPVIDHFIRPTVFGSRGPLAWRGNA